MANASTSVRSINPPPGTLAAGTPDKPALILLHGLGGSAEGWRAAMPQLASQYYVIALTLPGHPGGPPVGAVDLSSLVEHVFANMKQLEIEQAHLAGVSLGGSIAVEASRASAEQKQKPKILSVCATGPGDVVARADLQLANQRIRRLVDIAKSRQGGLRQLAKEAPIRKLALSLIAQNGDSLSEQEFAGFIEALLALREGGVLDRYLEVPKAPFKPMKVSCPTTLIWGADDMLLPLRPNAAVAEENLTGAKLEILPGCGHSTLIDDPSATIAVMAKVVP